MGFFKSLFTFFHFMIFFRIQIRNVWTSVRPYRIHGLIFIIPTTDSKQPPRPPCINLRENEIINRPTRISFRVSSKGPVPVNGIPQIARESGISRNVCVVWLNFRPVKDSPVNPGPRVRSLPLPETVKGTWLVTSCSPLPASLTTIDERSADSGKDSGRSSAPTEYYTICKHDCCTERERKREKHCIELNVTVDLDRPCSLVVFTRK